MVQHIGELSISLTACDELGRWDTQEQATDVAEELSELSDNQLDWAVIQHHNHWHVFSVQAVRKELFDDR
jgi:hypothetical protein